VKGRISLKRSTAPREYLELLTRFPKLFLQLVTLPIDIRLSVSERQIAASFVQLGLVI
jgi:hypothetical protein